MNIENLLENNQRWSEGIRTRDPEFFHRLANQQKPEYLWIGCSDSRVPANEIVGLMPGELFVHRNVANLVVATDMNLLAVLQYAVEVLRVKHIIVCGHYGCGGVRAAMQAKELGLIDNWLRAIKVLYHQSREHLEGLSENDCLDLLCELNVKRQVRNVCHTTIVQNAWLEGQELCVHGWIYGLETGLLKDLATDICSRDQLDDPFLYER